MRAAVVDPVGRNARGSRHCCSNFVVLIVRLCVFVFRSKVIALSESLDSSYFRRSRNCAQNCEKSKNRRKSLCAPLRIDN